MNSTDAKIFASIFDCAQEDIATLQIRNKKLFLPKSQVVTSNDTVVRGLQLLIWWYFCFQYWTQNKFSKVIKTIDLESIWSIQQNTDSEEYFQYTFERTVMRRLNILFILLFGLAAYIFRIELEIIAIYLYDNPTLLFSIANVAILYGIYQYINSIYKPQPVKTWVDKELDFREDMIKAARQEFEETERNNQRYLVKDYY